MSYTWHEVSEAEREKIKKQAKDLLDKFSSKLEGIRLSEKVVQEGGENLREEGNGWKTNEDFREFMMDNAPFVDDGLIVAEKGWWK